MGDLSGVRFEDINGDVSLLICVPVLSFVSTADQVPPRDETTGFGLVMLVKLPPGQTRGAVSMAPPVTV